MYIERLGNRLAPCIAGFDLTFASIPSFLCARKFHGSSRKAMATFLLPTVSSGFLVLHQSGLCQRIYGAVGHADHQTGALFGMPDWCFARSPKSGCFEVFSRVPNLEESQVAPARVFFVVS